MISRILRVAGDADSPSMVMATQRRSRLATTLLPLLAAGGSAAGAVATTAGFHQYTAVGCATAIAVHGTVNLDPYAMVAISEVSGLGTITTYVNGTTVWELGGGDYGNATGSPLSGFASLVEGTLGQWLKQVGDEVRQGEPLASIETDKVTTEMTSLRQLMNELRTPVPAILPPNTAWRPQPAEVGYAPV